ncbi:hypothetical protein [Streptomyces sp. NBC_01197]|uniref:hypothetical protein n=1 Tax=Streptomyces sp. NBC_01197 TaxID=2903768 RepID=UPI002E14EAB7|nr:hypothetical protein OG452_05425 [Streptomyces sp. NBC_01197]
MESEKELIQALTEEIQGAIQAGGRLHENDVFDLAYHAGQVLGLDVDAMEGVK